MSSAALPCPAAGLKAAGGASWLFGAGVKTQVTGLARQFMLGSDKKQVAATLCQLHYRGIAFTVDVLGETVVSETKADQYAQRYLRLMDSLAPQVAKWPHPCQGNEAPHRFLPALNVSVKLSALYSQIHPADPDTAVEKIGRGFAPSSAGRRNSTPSSTSTWRATR